MRTNAHRACGMAAQYVQQHVRTQTKHLDDAAAPSRAQHLAVDLRVESQTLSIMVSIMVRLGQG